MMKTMQKVYFGWNHKWKRKSCFNQNYFCHIWRLIGHPVLLISHFIFFVCYPYSNCYYVFFLSFFSTIFFNVCLLFLELLKVHLLSFHDIRHLRISRTRNSEGQKLPPPLNYTGSAKTKGEGCQKGGRSPKKGEERRKNGQKSRKMEKKGGVKELKWGNRGK